MKKKIIAIIIAPTNFYIYNVLSLLPDRNQGQFGIRLRQRAVSGVLPCAQVVRHENGDDQLLAIRLVRDLYLYPARHLLLFRYLLLK